MKRSIIAAASLCACLASCDRERPTAGEESPDTTVPASEIGGSGPPPVVTRVIEPEEFQVAEEEPASSELVEPTAGERLDHAIEKTEEGLRRAAGATGGALRRAGDAIEKKAEEAESR